MQMVADVAYVGLYPRDHSLWVHRQDAARVHVLHIHKHRCCSWSAMNQRENISTAGAADAWFGSPFCAEMPQMTAYPGSSMFYNSILWARSQQAQAHIAAAATLSGALPEFSGADKASAATSPQNCTKHGGRSLNVQAKTPILVLVVMEVSSHFVLVVYAENRVQAASHIQSNDQARHQKHRTAIVAWPMSVVLLQSLVKVHG